jgi:hypothetical protein
MQSFGFEHEPGPRGGFDDAHLRALLLSFVNHGGNILGWRVGDGWEETDEDELLRPLIETLRAVDDVRQVDVKVLGSSDEAWHDHLSWWMARARRGGPGEVWLGEHEGYGKFVLVRMWMAQGGTGISHIWQLAWISPEGLERACADAGVDLGEWRSRSAWVRDA